MLIVFLEEICVPLQFPWIRPQVFEKICKRIWLYFIEDPIPSVATDFGLWSIK